MKRALSLALVGAAAALLFGCPIYEDGREDRVCTASGCYVCPDDYFTSDCVPWTCRTSRDCPGAYVCGVGGYCVADGTGVIQPTPATPSCSASRPCSTGLTCGADGLCHTQDCVAVGCASGECVVRSGVASCTTSGTDGGTSVTTCTTDDQCNGGRADGGADGGAGTRRCLSGQCYEPSQQCTDTTHCLGGAVCVDGACRPSCGGSKACPASYQCDAARGVCVGNTEPCSTTSQCPSGSVCSVGRCVAPCAPGGGCASDLVCVAGGCVANETPSFACNADGRLADGVQGECREGSICLRRSCYIACTQSDGGASDGGGGCRAADVFNVCKSVATSSGSFAVCSSATGLGTECGPTAAPCTGGKVCIDGTCR